MKKYIQFPVVFSLTSLFIFCFPTIVQAIPPLPSSFYGIVVLNNANLPEGTTIEALINGQVVTTGKTQMYQGQSVYAVDVPGDDLSSGVIEGGRDGEVIAFRVGGNMAEQTSVWKSGTNVQLNLTAGAITNTTAVQPSQTPVPTATSTPSLVVVEPSATIVLEQIASTSATLPEPTAVMALGAGAAATTQAIPVMTTTPGNDGIEQSVSNTSEGGQIADVHGDTSAQELDLPMVMGTSSEVRSSWQWIVLPIVFMGGGVIGLVLYKRKRHGLD